MGILRSLILLPAALVGMTLAHAVTAQGASLKPPKMFFEGDMVLHQACVLQNRFQHNEGVVWRVRVLDAKTGKQLNSKSLKSLVVELPGGEKLPMKYGGHPKGKKDDIYWTVLWIVPENYPTGTFAYQVVATDLRGDSVRWQPFAIKNSQFTVVDD